MSKVIKQFQSLEPIMEMNKAQIKYHAKVLAEEINASGSAEVAFAKLHKLEEFVKSIKDNIKASAMFEVEQGRNFASGIKMEIMNSTRYEYNDHIIDELKTKIKEREAFLKSLKTKVTIVDDETGEVDEAFPAIKRVTETIKCSYI